MALILIIDDSSYMRGKVRGFLKSEGHEVIEADDGIKGLQMASSQKPDCIVLDIIMPGMDGFKIIQAVREQGLKVPMIVVTADIQDSTRRHCTELGASAVVNKPPKDSELRNAVNNALYSKKEVAE